MVAKTQSVTNGVFDGFEALEGFDPIDKAALVGVPFGITGVRFRTNEQAVTFAEVEIVQSDGEQAAISDSSTGVRDQLKKFLAEKGEKYEPNSDWYDVKLFAPKGLRVSTYQVTDDRGKEKTAKTYYLTTGGRAR